MPETSPPCPSMLSPCMTASPLCAVPDLPLAPSAPAQPKTFQYPHRSHHRFTSHSLPISPSPPSFVPFFQIWFPPSTQWYVIRNITGPVVCYSFICSTLSTQHATHSAQSKARPLDLLSIDIHDRPLLLLLLGLLLRLPLLVGCRRKWLRAARRRIRRGLPLLRYGHAHRLLVFHGIVLPRRPRGRAARRLRPRGALPRPGLVVLAQQAVGHCRRGRGAAAAASRSAAQAGDASSGRGRGRASRPRARLAAA